MWCKLQNEMKCEKKSIWWKVGNEIFMRTVMGTVHEMQSVKEAAYEMQSAMGQELKWNVWLKHQRNEISRDPEWIE